ncbi:MAG: ABC transporter permease [Bacteroidia bacterium]|nr:ABC transporter permease [Bacteroidia bacterium]
MFRNYLLVTFRNLLKNKVFTLINIIGLGIALSVCIVAFFNHMFNYEFDRTHENFNEIYRITCFRDMQGREQEYGRVPSTLGLLIKKDIPGILKASRLHRSGSMVKMGDDLFPAQISFVDPEFLEIFTFHSIFGDTKSVPGTGNVLISETMAKTLFGEEYPVGKSISLVNDQNKEFSFTVSAVFSDLPENSSFRIDILSHYENFLSMWGANDADWKLWTTALFIQVQEKSLIPSIASSLKDYLLVQNKAREDFRINRFSLVPLKEVGSNSRDIWSSGLFPSLHPAALIAPSVMAIFILLLACFNFANTSRSIFSRRLKEIGLRKTFGGLRKQLVTQFMFETFIICLLALIVGIAFAEFLVPAYSSLWSYMSIEMTFTRYAFFWVFLIMLVLVTGFLAGVYPALYVSSFSPVSIIKGDSSIKGSGKLSLVLLTLQFSISIMSLVMGIVFARNAEYQKTLDLGFDRDKLIIAPISSELFTAYRNEIITNPKIISAEGTINHLGWGSYRRPIKDAEKQLEVDVMDIGPEYAQTIGLRLRDGRLFDKNRAEADKTNGSIIVNQKLVKDFGWPDGVGRTVTLYDTTTLTIIGVVEDFYISGVWEEIEPAMLRVADTRQFSADSRQFVVLVVRANPEDLPGVLDFMDQKWKAMGTNYLFGGRLQEDLMQEEKDINGSILKVNVFLAIVATLLSLIGMYNLVSLDIIKRTKEVGIRKIQGAPVPILMFLVSRKFLIVLLISSILGCAGGYYMSLSLMDSIWDYFTKITPGILLLSALIMIVATILTISVKVVRAALRNPVESLHYE